MKKTNLVIVFLLIANTAYSQPSNKTPPTDPKKASQPYKNPTQKDTIAAVGLDKGEAKTQEGTNKQRDEDRKLQIDALEENKRLGVYTFWMAVFTFCLGGAAIWQAAITRGTAKRQLRAYVGIRPDPKYPPTTLRELHTVGLRFQIINYGNTPAHDVIHKIDMGAWEENEPVFGEINRPLKGSKFVLHPSATSDLKIIKKSALTEQEIASMMSGKLKIYVWGKIWYRDAFDEGRWTSFSWRQSGESLQWTEKGNDAN